MFRGLARQLVQLGTQIGPVLFAVMKLLILSAELRLQRLGLVRRRLQPALRDGESLGLGVQCDRDLLELPLALLEVIAHRSTALLRLRRASHRFGSLLCHFLQIGTRDHISVALGEL